MRSIFARASKLDRKGWSVLTKQFLPIFGIAAILPILLFTVVSGQSFSLSSRAAKTPELRLWLSPASVITKPHQKITLTLYAAFDNDKMYLQSFSAELTPNGAISLLSDTVSYTKPFQGQIIVGQIDVTTTAAGTATITIPQERVKTSLTQSINILTSPATITIKNE